MCAKKTKGKHRLDKYYYLAKEQGFRSRAAFKLVQLNKKYDFLGNARSLLDLCAAPGGWLQVAHKYMPLQSLIVGIDLVPIKPIRGVITITEDITTERCRAAIKKTLPGKDALFDVVICDGAPNVGGAWAREAYTQAALILDACKLATEFLAPKGMFVTKVFRSQEYHALIYCFQQLFDRVESTKPMASRSQSAEIYVICKGYKAPSKIDKRLLDPSHMFAETQDDGPRVIDVLNPKEVQKRNRGGYEAGTGVLYKECSAEEFVTSDRPADILGIFNRMTVEPGSELAEHPETSVEVQALMADLRVLGRKEFKQLLKWRQEVIKTRKRAEKEVLKAAGKDKPAKTEGGEEDEEDKLMEEMEGLQQRTEARKRREKKKVAKMKSKARERAALGAAGQDPEAVKESAYSLEDDLFSLTALRSKKQLDRVADASAPDAEELEDGDEPVYEAKEGDGKEFLRHYGHTGVSDSEDEGRGEDDEMLEGELDSMYATYATRRGIKAAKELKKARARLGKGGELGVAEEHWDAEGSDEDWDDPAKQAQKAAEKKKAEKVAKGMQPAARAPALSDDDDDGAPNPLLPAPKPVRPNATGQALASQWFSNPAFAGLGRSDVAASGAVEPRVGQKRPASKPIDDSSDEEGGSDSEDDVVAIRRASMAGAVARANHGAVREDVDFETVAADKDEEASVSGSSDSEDHDLDLLDDDTKAEIRAYGKLFRHRKTREGLVDGSYSKRVHNDEDAPEWFLNDERRHNRINKPVTAAEVKEAKDALRALNARPIKKVAEAKARKRQRVTTKMDAARNKANAIADQEDMPMNSRMREIERIYARTSKALWGKKGGKGKGKTKGGKAKKPPGVDTRMKKDTRSMNKKSDKAANRKNPRGGGGAAKKGGAGAKKGGGGGGKNKR